MIPRLTAVLAGAIAFSAGAAYAAPDTQAVTLENRIQLVAAVGRGDVVAVGHTGDRPGECRVGRPIAAGRVVGDDGQVRHDRELPRVRLEQLLDDLILGHLISDREHLVLVGDDLEAVRRVVVVRVAGGRARDPAIPAQTIRQHCRSDNAGVDL